MFACILGPSTACLQNQDPVCFHTHNIQGPTCNIKRPRDTFYISYLISSTQICCMHLFVTNACTWTDVSTVRSDSLCLAA